MDFLKGLSDSICTSLIPQFSDELEYAYVISTVLLAVNSAERSWHRDNLFVSFFRTLLYVHGASLIMAICLGESPVAQLADMTGILTALLVWWVALFAPFDLLNRLLDVTVRDVKPLLLLLSVMTALRNLMAVNGAVDVSLEKFPGSLVAILLGTIGGGGTYAVAGVFGDFARQISSESVTKNAFIAALLLTLTKVYFATCIGANLVLTLCIVLILPLSIAESLNKELDIFTPAYDILKQLVNLRDLLAKKKQD